MRDQHSDKEPPGNSKLQLGPSPETAALQLRASTSTSDRWYTRGFLPHLESENKIQHVCFHLADSLPQEVLRELEGRIATLPKDQRELEQRKRVEAYLDAGYGCCVLKDPDLACMMQNTLLHFDAVRYDMFAWVIMPNHVHTLFRPCEGWRLASIIDSWKSYSGRRLASAMRQAGAWSSQGKNPHAWHREHWDRFIRDEKHFENCINYIHQNPVTAGLAASVTACPWSSAYKGLEA